MYLESKENNSYIYHPSIVTKSELSRSISNKLITFASVFDELDYNYIHQNNHSNFDINKSVDNEDLVIVGDNKSIDNQTNKNIESYPFPSENPSHSITKLNKPPNLVKKSNSRKKFLHELIHYHRSKSEPNVLYLLSSNPTTNDHYQSLKTFRQWIKSSSFGQFIQSIIKYPNRNSNTSIKKHLKRKSSFTATLSRKYSDLIY